MSRFQKIAARLKDYDLDALLILSEPNRLYATGFHSTAGAVLVTPEESYFFTDSRYIEAARRQVTEGVVEENTRQRNTDQLLTEALQRHNVRRLGYEDTRTTVAEYRRLGGKLPAELVPAKDLLENLRASKEPCEIAEMVKAQRIAEAALSEALNLIRPGRTEQEIAAFLQYQMLLRGAEKMSFDPIVVSGANSSMPHGVPSEKPVERGDFVTMDFGCVCGGYCSDMTRTVAVGSVTEEMEQVYHTVLQAQLAGIGTAKAGVTGAAIHAAGEQVIAEAGYGPYFGHGFGHSLGIEVHEGPNAAPAGKRPMPVGAVISAEPGIYLPGRFGVRIEDVLVLREDGCENITLANKDLIIL